MRTLALQRNAPKEYEAAARGSKDAAANPRSTKAELLTYRRRFPSSSQGRASARSSQLRTPGLHVYAKSRSPILPCKIACL